MTARFYSQLKNIIMKSFFIILQNIDDIFLCQSEAKPYELGVTIFYFDHKMKDKEVTFFLNLN